MKKLSITLSLIFITLGVMGQVKEINPVSSIIGNNIIADDFNRLDTVKCWFKEVEFVKWRYDKYIFCDENDELATIHEQWKRGYMVVRKGFMEFGYPVEVYLYSDRKTIVKNHVLNRIER